MIGIRKYNINIIYMIQQKNETKINNFKNLNALAQSWLFFSHLFIYLVSSCISSASFYMIPIWTMGDEFE